MYVKLRNGMGGLLDNERIFHFEPGDVVEWHDKAEAERLVERGIADPIGPLKAAELQAAGARVIRHPLIGVRKK